MGIPPGNVFASTAFSSYGGFWIGLFVWIRVTGTAATGHDLGWILLAFAIFNLYMLLMATQVNMAVFLVFLTLQLTEIFLSIGNFSSSAGLSQVGGYLGLDHRPGRLVHLGGGRLGRHRRQDPASGRQAADLLTRSRMFPVQRDKSHVRPDPTGHSSFRPVGSGLCTCQTGRSLTCRHRSPK